MSSRDQSTQRNEWYHYQVESHSRGHWWPRPFHRVWIFRHLSFSSVGIGCLMGSFSGAGFWCVCKGLSSHWIAWSSRRHTFSHLYHFFSCGDTFSHSASFSNCCCWSDLYQRYPVSAIAEKAMSLAPASLAWYKLNDDRAGMPGIGWWEKEAGYSGIVFSCSQWVRLNLVFRIFFSFINKKRNQKTIKLSKKKKK